MKMKNVRWVTMTLRLGAHRFGFGAVYEFLVWFNLKILKGIYILFGFGINQFFFFLCSVLINQSLNATWHDFNFFFLF